MALQSVEEVRRQCRNIRRMIGEKEKEIRHAETLIDATERGIRDLQNQIRDPNVDPNLKKEFVKDLPEIEKQLAKHRNNLREARAKLAEYQNHYNIVGCGSF